MMEFLNVYEDQMRAESYAKMEFPGTYYLAYRDLPEIISRCVRGTRALDFGCGTGRSTRFLRGLGFSVTGVDISEEMLRRARGFDPDGEYVRLREGRFDSLQAGSFDLVLSVFTFDNIPGHAHRTTLLQGLRNLVIARGRIILLDSTPELYVNEWSSFSTKNFSENKRARSGDTVRTVMLDVEDQRPVEDILWYDHDYRRMFRDSSLRLVETVRPLGREHEPFAWVNETRIAPWVIYVLDKDTISL